MAGTEGATITFAYDCPYRGICSENGVKCETCKHSPKRSYYEPVEAPRLPQYPVEPFIPYTYVWTTREGGDVTGQSSSTEKQGNIKKE